MKEDVKRTVMAPSNPHPSRAGELLSVELRADEDVQWIWCHHGERGSSVIGYTIATREPTEIRGEAADRILLARIEAVALR